MFDKFLGLLAFFAELPTKTKAKSGAVALVFVLLLVLAVVGAFWSVTPDPLKRDYRADGQVGGSYVVGYATTAALDDVVSTLLDKPGGYLSNDIMPPGVWLDNMPNWEWGVLVQVRDLARSLRNDMSRSQSQSVENLELAEADPLLHFNNDSWIFPATESEYKRAIKHLRAYRSQLEDGSNGDAQFFARADNLASWLALVEKRLGSLSQRLSASVGQERVNTDLAGDASAEQAAPAPAAKVIKTPWFQIDDVFYEAKGTAWALVSILHAVEVDFAQVLEKKNALVSVRQIRRELEATQQSLISPMVMNGDGFGMFANHSLVMASYIARANAAIIDLRKLLADG